MQTKYIGMKAVLTKYIGDAGSANEVHGHTASATKYLGDAGSANEMHKGCGQC